MWFQLFIVTAEDDLEINLCAPFVITEKRPEVFRRIAYFSEVPSEDPFAMIPFDAPESDAGFTHASIVKLPVRSIEEEFWTRT